MKWLFCVCTDDLHNKYIKKGFQRQFIEDGYWHWPLDRQQNLKRFPALVVVFCVLSASSSVFYSLPKVPKLSPNQGLKNECAWPVCLLSVAGLFHRTLVQLLEKKWKLVELEFEENFTGSRLMHPLPNRGGIDPPQKIQRPLHQSKCIKCDEKDKTALCHKAVCNLSIIFDQ